MVHSVDVTNRPQNFEAYRYVVTCSCGWQGRMATEEAAKSQGLAHLVKWGVGPDALTVNIANEEVAKEEVVKEKEVTAKMPAPQEQQAPHAIFGGEGKSS